MNWLPGLAQGALCAAPVCLCAALACVSGCTNPVAAQHRVIDGPRPISAVARGNAETEVLTLLPLKPAPTAQAAGQDGGAKGLPLQVAQGLDLERGGSSAELMPKLVWLSAADGGKQASFRVHVPGAKALRIGLLIEKWPAAASIAVSTPASSTLLQSPGEEILRSLQQLSTPVAGVMGQFWTPQTTGDLALVRVNLPAGVSTEAVRFSAARVSSFFAAAR